MKLHETLSAEVKEKYITTMVSVLERLSECVWCEITSLSHSPDKFDIREFIDIIQSLCDSGHYDRANEFGNIYCIIDIKEDKYIRLSPDHIRLLNTNKYAKHQNYFQRGDRPASRLYRTSIYKKR